MLFGGDDQCYRTVKEVSDGFEHGYRPLDELRQMARPIREAAATYLRRAIVDLSRVPEPTRTEMLSVPYDAPIIGFPITKYLRGTLTGSGELAAPGQLYPSVAWRTDIKSFREGDDGRHQAEWSENVTPRIGPDVQLTDIRIELWSANKNAGTAATMQRAVVERAASADDVAAAGTGASPMPDD